jgi:hypothetical protein
MKFAGQLAAVLLLVMALWVAAGILPKLLPPAAAIFGMVVIGRIVFFLTRHDRW